MVGTIKVGKLQAADGTSDTISIESGHSLHAPGHVIQVAEGTIVSNSQFSTTSTSLADVGLSVQITPKFSTSKVLILFQGFGGSSGDNTALLIQIQRKIGSGSYTLVTGGGFFYEDNQYESCGLNKLDSPSTTSQITYKLQGQLSSGAAGTAYLPGGWGGDYNTTGFTTITALEIAQ